MAHINIEEKGDRVILEVNRPEALNALSEAVLQELRDVFSDLSSRSDLSAVIVTGAGPKAFVAGADIQAMSGYDAEKISDYVSLGQALMCDIERFPLPVIAAVNGYALGGGMELALACDLIYCSSEAVFGQPEVCLGILPGFGGTQRLVWRCGIGAAKRLIYTGEKIGADEALRIGLVEGVFESDNLLDEVEKIVDRISKNAPLAVSSSKKVIQESIADTLSRGLTVEVDEFCKLFASEDRAEGMNAFVEKRKPEYKGK